MLYKIKKNKKTKQKMCGLKAEVQFLFQTLRVQGKKKNVCWIVAELKSG